jgi:hypothetical protein
MAYPVGCVGRPRPVDRNRAHALAALFRTDQWFATFVIVMSAVFEALGRTPR